MLMDLLGSGYRPPRGLNPNGFKSSSGSVQSILKRENKTSKLFDVTPRVLYRRFFTSKHVLIFHHALKIASNQASSTKISHK
jgi:hypothetical protein